MTRVTPSSDLSKTSGKFTSTTYIYWHVQYILANAFDPRARFGSGFGHAYFQHAGAKELDALGGAGAFYLADGSGNRGA